MILLDLVICTTPRGKSTEDNKQFADDVFGLIKKLKRLNKEKHRLDHLFYLLEFPSCIKNHVTSLHDSSHCVLEPKTVHVCNWPIPSEIMRWVGSGAKHNSSGQPQDSPNPGTLLLVLFPRIMIVSALLNILPLITNSCFIHTSDNTLQILTQCFVCWIY